MCDLCREIVQVELFVVVVAFGSGGDMSANTWPQRSCNLLAVGREKHASISACFYIHAKRSLPRMMAKTHI